MQIRSDLQMKVRVIAEDNMEDCKIINPQTRPGSVNSSLDGEHNVPEKAKSARKKLIFIRNKIPNRMSETRVSSMWVLKIPAWGECVATFISI